MSIEKLYPKFIETRSALELLQKRYKDELDYKKYVNKRLSGLNEIRIFLLLNPQFTDLRIHFSNECERYDLVSNSIIPTEFEIIYNQPSIWCHYPNPNIRLLAYTMMDGIKIRMPLFKIGRVMVNCLERKHDALLESDWEQLVLTKCGIVAVNKVKSWVANPLNYNSPEVIQ